jgi:hypothetical protein
MKRGAVGAVMLVMALVACGRTVFSGPDAGAGRDGGVLVVRGTLTGERMHAQCNTACDACADPRQCRFECLSAFLVGSPRCETETLALFDCARDAGRCAQNLDTTCPGAWNVWSSCLDHQSGCRAWTGPAGTCEQNSRCVPNDYATECTFTDLETSCDCKVNGAVVGSCSVSATCPACPSATDRCTAAMVGCCFDVFFP